MLQIGRREMRGEGVGQAEHGGELRTVGARSEDPDLHVLALAGHGANARVLRWRREIADQLDHVLRETVDAGLEVAAQRARRRHVGARRAAEAEIDAAGMQCGQRAECSAMTSGAWLGSMTPPAPTRIVDVPAATWAMTTDVAALAMPRHVVMLGEPVA